MSDVIEGFLVDSAFRDRAKSVSGMLSQDANQICSFTPHGSTYFNTPVKMTDPGVATARKVAWTSTTKATLLVDTQVFTEFSSIYTALSAAQDDAMFRIIDRLAFNNDPTATDDDLDAILSADDTLTGFYVPKSVSRSTVFTPTEVWLDNETQLNISVPNYVRFDIQVTAGTETVQSTLMIYLNCDSFVANYSKSTIKTVVPPLPYATLLTASLSAAVGNVFTTANLSATLSYNTQSPDLALNTMSGQCMFMVTLVDGTTSLDVPFNLLYKGKYPSISQIRDAIRSQILASNAGTEDQWRSRAPGLFIVARFYLFPLWDAVVTKPNTVLNQGITQLSKVADLNKSALLSAGLDTDITSQALFESGYDGMVILTVPDDGYKPMDSSMVGSKYILDYFPDFQTCTSLDTVYALLSPQTQLFIKRLNEVLAKASGASTTDTTMLTQEGALTYYSISINDLEMCLVTKDCYTTLLKATQ